MCTMGLRRRGLHIVFLMFNNNIIIIMLIYDNLWFADS